MSLIGDLSRWDLIWIGDTGRVRNDGGLDGGGAVVGRNRDGFEQAYLLFC